MSEKTPRKRIILSKPVQVSIFRRDGWLCRWCSKPVIFAPAMKFLELELRSAGRNGPVAYYQRNWSRATSPLLDELGAVLDHVHAFTLNGPCDPENLATTCAKCNGRKGSVSIEEWAKRPLRKPIKGKYGEPATWDGFSNVFIVFASRHFSALTQDERGWLKALTQD